MANADALVFFINEQTLRDENCLLTLQYAWNLTLPILMLRPPMTKLVISNREAHREREKIMHIGECAIVRSTSGEPWQLLNDGNSESVDYTLLQDVLHGGYRLSTLYDVQSHAKSLARVRRKLSTVFSTTNFLLPLSKGGSSSSSQPHFYLSPSNSSLCDAQKLSKSRSAVIKPPSATKIATRRQSGSSGDNNKTRLNLSMSTGNLCRTGVVRTPYPKAKQFQFEEDGGDEEDETDEEDTDLVSIKTHSGRRRNVLKSPPPPDRIPSSVGASEVDEKDDTFLKLMPDNIQHSIFKTPTLDLPIGDDSFPLPPPTPKTPGSGLFSIPSGRNTENTSRSRFTKRSRFGSITSRTSSLDRRMSLSCLEDISNYQKTQYLVFPLRDSTKKPYLLKFPEDMHEEEEKHGGSVWGSDTSLEEEIKVRMSITISYIC
ncbi:hypothetical protein CRE_25374 [Caenorhabditis remanei]|uniref:Uncharacterized protein n=1 Tax=Caenorhabditis remanei TaxID=31234 RepID=E3LST1_CAERE|nr:hypothetical protein CRE_25374 [Caenorhabditis remanei]